MMPLHVPETVTFSTRGCVKVQANAPETVPYFQCHSTTVRKRQAVPKAGAVFRTGMLQGAARTGSGTRTPCSPMPDAWFGPAMG